MEQATAAPLEQAPPASATEERLADLRALAERDAARAQREAWAWIVELGARARNDRLGAAAELNELFRLGTPPRGLDGETDGILVAPLIRPALDVAIRAISAIQMPWLGKRFDAAAARGDNLLVRSARFPMRLIWPAYRPREAGGVLAAFDFETRVESGKADPDRETLAIDYAPVDSNPRLIIRRIRDELVELVPDTHLGKVLWTREPDWPCIGYFALRQPPA